MNTLVLYSSKTGYTKNYAQWLGKALEADIRSLKDYDFNTLANYDTIIFGGGLYAGGINGIKTLKKHLTTLKQKNLAIFFTGASPSSSFEVSEIREQNFSSKEAEGIEFFYMRGGYDYTRLGLIDKLLMNLLKASLKRKQKKGELTPDEKGMLSAYDLPVDFTKEYRIKPLVEWAFEKGV